MGPEKLHRWSDLCRARATPGPDRGGTLCPLTLVVSLHAAARRGAEPARRIMLRTKRPAVVVREVGSGEWPAPGERGVGRGRGAAA